MGRQGNQLWNDNTRIFELIKKKIKQLNCQNVTRLQAESVTYYCGLKILKYLNLLSQSQVLRLSNYSYPMW